MFQPEETESDWIPWLAGVSDVSVVTVFRLLFFLSDVKKRNFYLVDNRSPLISWIFVFLVELESFLWDAALLLNADADTRRHDQHENGAHLLVPGDDKVKWKSVSGYSTWKQRYQWLARLIPRCSWPRPCWAFYVPSHLHVDSGAFTSAAFSSKKTGSRRY